MHFSVEQGSLKEALLVLRELPEFDPLLSGQYYRDRLSDHDSYIIVAKSKGKIVGCKIGYDRYKDGSFYSWLGGVIPSYRHLGIAKAMLVDQHEWAKRRGYDRIRFKTLNRHKAMLIFSIKNGFEIFNVKTKDELENNRIELIKYL